MHRLDAVAVPVFGMRFAYADPPYVGQARKHYRKHPDYAGEVDQRALLDRLMADYPDGWALSLSCKSLQTILGYCPPDVRVMAWCKPMTPLLPGIRLQYGWEPVILRGGRQGPSITGSTMLRDWIAVSPDGWAFRPRPPGHVLGRKPDAFCRWLFDCLGARQEDELDDLFPGSGAVGRAWEAWRAQVPLGVVGARLQADEMREVATHPAGPVVTTWLADVADLGGLTSAEVREMYDDTIRVDEAGIAWQKCPRCGQERVPSHNGIARHDEFCAGLAQPAEHRLKAEGTGAEPVPGGAPPCEP